MRRLLLPAALLAAACSRPPQPFVIGVLAPVGPRTAAACAAEGMEVAASAPESAAVESAAAPNPAGGENMAPWAKLRFLAARAQAGTASGVYFRLPAVPSGDELLDYSEEWQALERVAREVRAVRPILERGVPVQPPFPVPSGVEVRAWKYGGRLYLLLVNAGEAAPLSPERLEPWRALFTARSDAREALAPCAKGFCLPAEGVLWLEGRPFAAAAP